MTALEAKNLSTINIQESLKWVLDKIDGEVRKGNYEVGITPRNSLTEAMAVGLQQLGYKIISYTHDEVKINWE